MDYLSNEQPSEQASEEPQSQAYTVKSNGRVNVRSAASMDGDHVRWLENGDVVQVKSWFDGWAYIGDGYVLGKWIKVELEAVE